MQSVPRTQPFMRTYQLDRYWPAWRQFPGPGHEVTPNRGLTGS
jgi:hypothetical protein